VAAVSTLGLAALRTQYFPGMFNSELYFFCEISKFRDKLD